jgi:hypothetical protein
MDDLTLVNRLTGLVVHSGKCVDSLQCMYLMSDGTTGTGTQWGGSGGAQETITLGTGEFIVLVEGHAGSILDQIMFTTNKGTKFGPYGNGGGGTAFWQPVTELGGFYGRSGTMMDCVGFLQYQRRHD